jgi:hypothetical protein
MKKFSAFLLAVAFLSTIGSNVALAQRRAGAGQAAITDSTTGTAGTTAAAGTGVHTITVPIILSKVSAADVLTAYTPGYKFKLLSASFAVSSPATTAAKAATLGLKIGSTSVTGGSIALTSANSTPLGALVAGSSITAANTGSATDTITVAATSVTAFVEGEGMLLLKVQNMDTADAHASELRMLNEIRATLINRSGWKGAP